MLSVGKVVMGVILWGLGDSCTVCCSDFRGQVFCAVGLVGSVWKGGR